LPESALEKGRIQEQIERVAESPGFRNGPVLQRLLRYLCSSALEGVEGDLKESVIGVEVFGRECCYDPKVDTIVRVHVHRLRFKLKQYYDDEGAKDEIIIEIPRGRYAPTFQSQTEVNKGSASYVESLGDHVDPDSELARTVAGHTSDSSDEVNTTFVTQSSSHYFTAAARILRRTIFAWSYSVPLVACLFGLSVGIGAGLLIGRLNRSQTADDIPQDVRSFWNSFLEGDSSPVLAYPDATFLLDQTNDLFSFRGPVDYRGTLVDPHLAKSFASNPAEVERAGPLNYENEYSGAGELESVAIISHVVTELGARLIVKPGSEVSPGDLMNHNVILLGSSFQNNAVRELAAKGDFRFITPEGNTGTWQARILNTKVHAGELPAYRTERDTSGTLLSDSAVVAILPSIDGKYHLMLLAGLDTSGTKGATMFTTSSQGIEDLVKAGVVPKVRSGSQTYSLSTFQALLKVELQKGRNVVNSQLLTVHRF
jgi:hypothetical protein